MFGFLKKQACPIGIDVDDDRVKLSQLEDSGNGLVLVSGVSRERPKDTSTGSSKWQRWLLDTVIDLTQKNSFVGKDVVASVPPRELFIDHLKIPKGAKSKLEESFINKVKQRLPFDPEQAVLKYIQSDDNVLVMVTDREKIDHHLAVYEQAGLNLKSIGVWPMALAKTYVKFFGRRKTDVDSIAMILDIAEKHSNILITRHVNPLFAKSVQIGADDFVGEEAVKRFILELTACRRHFGSLYKKDRIERMIFLAGNNTSVTMQGNFAMIAKQLDIPAQMGNCMAVVEVSDIRNGIERRGCNFSWAGSFGLSLS